jgi:hypothetical protein
MNLATPLLLPPQEIGIDNQKKKKSWESPNIKGPYNSMRLENPRKNWKEGAKEKNWTTF